MAKAPGSMRQELPASLRRTLTYDRGVEMVHYAGIQDFIDAQVYFCEPIRAGSAG
jgi:IS30 family transposase